MAMVETKSLDAAHVEELIPLLREYTEKLRLLSDEVMFGSLNYVMSSVLRNFWKLNLEQTFVGVATGITLLSFLMTLSHATSTDLVLLVSCVTCFGCAFFSFRDRHRFRDHLTARLGVHQPLSAQEVTLRRQELKLMVDQVTRLISRASQLDDHGDRHAGYRIELDLRLTEAEMAVTYANRTVLPAAARFESMQPQ